MKRNDIRWIGLCLLLGVAGLAVFLHLYKEAFPVASLDFKLSREEAFQQARGYLKELDYSTDQYSSAQIFSHDYGGQIFLEQTLGLEEANQLARDWLSIWSWSVRWFKTLEKEELRVSLDPGGRIVGFAHLILETDQGASLKQEEALGLAQTFLQETQGFDLAEWELIERTSEQRKARTDHIFTYRKKGFTVGEDGHYRLEVVVQGDRIGRFKEYLKVPEQFSRHYSEVRSRANLLSQIFGVFWFALGVMMLVVLVQKYRQGTLQWKTGLLVGGVVLVATAAGHTNSLPLARFGYDTMQSNAHFIAAFIASGLIGAVFSGGIISLAGTAGGALGREVLFAGKRSPFGHLALRRIFAGGFMRSTFVGYGLAFAMLGYVTLFYIVGTRYFGVWSPASVVDYDNTYSTAIPWIYPLLIGLVAAAQEEFFFRLLAISLLIRWFGRPWLAVVLSAVVWAFLHSNYPTEPIYTRGIEISLVGVALGFVFLRFGIWSTIIAHYVYNAFQGAFPMMKSSSLYFQISGFAVVGILLLPAIPALFAFLSRRYREIEEEAEEEVAEPLPPTPPAQPIMEETTVQKDPESYLIGARGWWWAGILGLVGVALLSALEIKRFGERNLELSVTRAEATGLAEEFCEAIGLDVRDHYLTAWFSSSLGTDHYIHLVRRAGVARADTLAVQQTHPWIWYLRWFKPQEKEEVLVGVNAKGRVSVFEHQIPESQAGAELEGDTARVLVQGFVEKHFDQVTADTLQYKLLEGSVEKQEARVDHHFVWERIDQKVDDGEFRLVTRLQGDRVGHFHQGYKAPEDFLRELGKQGAKDIVPKVIGVILGLATLILGGVNFFRIYREKTISWGLGLRFGILGAVLVVVDKVNALPAFFQNYDTSQALWTFLSMEVMGTLLEAVFIGLSMVVLVALGLALFREIHPEEMDPARWLGLLRLRQERAGLWLQAILMATAFLLATKGMDHFKTYAEYRWLVDYLKPGGYHPPNLNTYLPVLDGLTSAYLGVIALFAGLTGLLIWQRTLQKTWILIAGIILVGGVMGTAAQAEDIFHFAMLVGLVLLFLAVPLFLVVRVVRFNFLVYMICIWTSGLIGNGWSLWETDHLFYQINGMFMMGLGTTPLALLVITYLRPRIGG